MATAANLDDMRTLFLAAKQPWFITQITHVLLTFPMEMLSSDRPYTHTYPSLSVNH